MTQPEEKSKSFTFNDLPKMMLDESCYHGLLPREDLPCLLEQVGDFLIRITQLKPGDPHEFVLSLRVSDEDSPSAIRHVVIHRQKRKDGKIEWLTNEQNKFDSIKELINAYVSSKKPINPEIRTSQLIRPVARQSWEFLHENITLKEVLGEGQFGEVRAAEALIDGKKIPVAVKIAKTIKDKKQLEQAKEKVKEMMHEARLMRYFDHENVVKIHGVAVCREPLMIIIEMVKGGCLSDVLECRKGKIDEIEKVENMSLGSARGLEYIHIQGIIHRDIAARNVLYTEQKVAKISDFGMSRQGDFYEMSKGNKKVPLKWTAPESMVTYQYTPKTDVFSFSILLWEIFSDGEEPYKGMTSIEVKRMISCGERLKKPEGCPDFMFQIMGKCWEQNPDNRYSMSQVVKHIEDIVEHAYSEISDSPAAVNTEVCLSVEKLGSKDEVNDWNGHPSIISSRSRKRRKKHHRRRKRHKKSRMHKSERKKAMSRRRQMKSTHNGL
ncbi:Fer-related kinase [Dirofilaria immitis]